MINVRMEKAEKRIKELEATSEWLVRSNDIKVGIMDYIEGYLSNKTSKVEARNLDGTPVTQEEVANMDYCSKLEDRVEHLESTSDWLVRFSSTLREDVFEEIKKYLNNNMPHVKPCECKEIIDAITKQFYKDFDEKVRNAVDECLNGNDNSPAMDVVTKDDFENAVDEIYATIHGLEVRLRVHAEGLNGLTEKKINKMFKESGSKEEKEKNKEMEDYIFNNISPHIGEPDFTKLQEEEDSKSQKTDVITRDDLNAALEDERANYEKYIEDFMTDQGFNRPAVDPGDIEEVYNQFGELERNFRELEDGVQQEFIKLEAFNEKLEKKLKDIAEITKRLNNHDETIESIFKQLDSIVDDIDELREAGVGPECEEFEVEENESGIVDQNFNEQGNQGRKSKQKSKMKTKKDYQNTLGEMVERLEWLLKNGSIEKDEQEICNLVGELRFSNLVTMEAWNLFKQTMEYDQYVEQEPHFEKTLESIYSILKKDKLFEILNKRKKTTTQP